jgi:hypothetical protein
MVVNIKIPSPSELIPCHPERRISRIMRKRAREVPSLNNDSPSKIRDNRFGAPYSLKSASTATGSVAEISAAKRSATSIGIS